MSSFLYRLGRLCWRRRGRVLISWLLVLLVAGGAAGLAGGKFEESFSLPGTESQDALDQLAMTFPEVSGASAMLVVVAPEGQTVDDPAVKGVVENAVSELGERDRVLAAQSPYGDFVDGTISDNRRAAIVQVQLDGAMTDYTAEDKADLVAFGEELQQELPGSEVTFGGELFNADVPTLTVTEGLGLIVALIVLLFTLGSLRAAGMPLLTAVIGVGITMMLVITVAAFTTVSSTTPMLALMLGLAVGIDYALFILSRHREQLRAGLDAEESMARAVATSGSAVVFAGLTVVIALVGLSIAQLPFLTVMGIAAAGGVIIAVLIALTMLPALAGFAGDKLRPKPRKKKTARAAHVDEAKGAHAVNEEPTPTRPDGTTGGGASGWWVRLVTKVPIVTVVIVIAALSALAIPAKDLRLALPTAGINPEGTPSRVAYDLVAEHFGEGFNGPLLVTAEIIGSNDPLGLMDDLKSEIEQLDGVHLVPLATPNRTADTGIVQVVPTTGPTDPATEQLVQDIRAHAAQWEAEYGVEIAVTGYTAVAIDISDKLGGALLPFGIFVVGLSLILLAMVFRSIAVPLKATLGYLLSVLATFGATVLVFQDGFAASLIHLHDFGPLISFLPIVVMGILFGLAMDYEVFLVSRMREDYVHHGDARSAVRTGFIASAPVVVAAAVIMFAVFVFFVPESPPGTLKPIAFALAVGVALDAFVVRMTLVPAVLALLGDKAWWLPRWLDRLLPSFDVEGESLHRELELADWPAPNDNHVVYAEALALSSPAGTPVFGPINARLLPGEVLIVEGDPAQRTSLLLALAGRTKITAGRAKIAGHLLPEQAAQVRRSTDVLLADHARFLDDLGNARHPLLVVDGADSLSRPAQRTAVAQRIDQAIGDGRSVILGVADSTLIADLVPGSHYCLSLPDPHDPVSPPDGAATNGHHPQALPVGG